MPHPIPNILRDIGTFRENLLAFLNDVWLNINHFNADAEAA